MNPASTPPTASRNDASDTPRCGLCGKAEKLTRTPCCGRWICDDADQYVPFSYARNSCFRNHETYTICSFHHHQGHSGRWQDCAACRENGSLELYVYSATNEYNFEKLENPPSFEPTLCSRCGVRIRLAHDGYTMSQHQYLCQACGEAANPGQREAVNNMFGGKGDSGALTVQDYPIGTLAYYGPTNRLATKIAATIFKGPGADAEPLHRWITQAGDIRDDQVVMKQVAAFFRRHRVKHISSSERIMGCAHEEGKDYPVGEPCPHCPYWSNRDRFTLNELPAGGLSAAEILVELSKPDPSRQPLEAMAAADAHRDELIEPLLRAVERGIADPEDTPPGEAMLFSYATYLLAKWRERRAYPLFIRWLSLPGEGAFDIGSDTVTQDGGRLLAGVCGGDLEPIKQLILNREANEYCRSAGLAALACLVAWNELPQSAASDYFLWLAREGLEREQSWVWDELVSRCVDIEAIEVFPELRRAYDEGLADPGTMHPDDLGKFESCPRGGSLAKLRTDCPPITDVAHETSWWDCFHHDPLEEMKRDAATERINSQLKSKSSSPNDDEKSPSANDGGTPYALTTGVPFRAPPKVGRNDLCPCGSGKKYKKCCGK